MRIFEYRELEMKMLQNSKLRRLMNLESIVEGKIDEEL